VLRGDCAQVNPYISNQMNITSFVQKIDSDILSYGNAAVLHKTVKEFSNKEKLFDLIDSCVESDLDQMVEKSLLHSNGFDKLVLATGKHFNIRLHRFHPPQVMTPAESVHNHRWEFASSILNGSYTAQEFDVTQGPITRHHYTYTKNQGMIARGQAQISQVDEYTVTPGHSYFMNADTFHSITRIGDEGCITLMMTGLTDEFTTEVFTADEVSKDQQENCSCGLRMLAKDEVVSALNQIKEKIHG
jgi:hypothetical protein